MRAACQSVSRCREIKNSPPPRQVGKLNFQGSEVANTGVVTHVSERYLQQERPTSDHLHLLLLLLLRRRALSVCRGVGWGGRALSLIPPGGSKVPHNAILLCSLLGN